MAKDLVLVIDVQKAYLKGNPWECAGTDLMIENIKKIIESDKEKDIVFTQFLAPEDPKGKWLDYNEINREINESAELNEIADELKEYTEKYPVFTKSTYSSMKAPEVAEAAAKCKRLVVTGVVAECCVLATAMEADRKSVV